MAEAFWPGPLTLIVPGRGLFPDEILGPDGGVAIRYSSHPVAQELVAAVGPITSTSANRTGEPPLLSVDGHGLEVDALVDYGTIAPPSVYHVPSDQRTAQERGVGPGAGALLGAIGLMPASGWPMCASMTDNASRTPVPGTSWGLRWGPRPSVFPSGGWGVGECSLRAS